MKYDYIIWDFNGTIFDDVQIDIDSLNALLERRNLAKVKNRAEYQSGFMFPIKQWYVNRGFDLEKESFLMIGTPEGCVKMRGYFGEEAIVPIYLEIDDGERLRRAWARECGQKKPRFDEVCRRYLADEVDFAEDKLLEAGITERFFNDDVDRCCAQVEAKIRELI